MKKYAHVDFQGLKAIRDSAINYQTGQPFKQSEIAKLANMKQSYYSKIENGFVVSPNDEHMQGLAAAFSTSVHDLVEALPKKGTDQHQAFQEALKKSPLGGMHNYFNAPRVIDLYRRKGSIKGFKYNDAVLGESDTSVVPPPSLISSLEPYAVVVPTNDMEPRYKQGDTVFVDPDLMPYYGDDVVVSLQFKDRRLLLIRELVDMEAYYPNYRAMSDEDKQAGQSQPQNPDGWNWGDPFPSYGVMTASQVQFFKSRNPEMEDWEMKNHCTYYVCDPLVHNFDDDPDDPQLTAIDVHVIVASERARNVDQNKLNKFKRSGSPNPIDRYLYSSKSNSTDTVE